MKKRILSGMRPTGRLHIGHLFGAIKNWAKLQDEYDCHFMVADWHALTTGYMKPGEIKENVHQVIIDYISGGVDPEKCTFYIQSHVPEIAELHLLLSMTVPVSWVERCPTYKDQIQNLGPDIATYGFLGYPVLQTADVVSVRASLVPVGQDQVPHLEISREIVRRFNRLYKTRVFPEPMPKLTETPLVPGMDGRKMSKSYNNSIYISESADEIWKKLKKAVTDPGKIYKGDPGHPEICNAFYYHRLFNTRDRVEWIGENCRSGDLGCADCKKELHVKMTELLTPVWEKRRELEQDSAMTGRLLSAGCEKARETVRETLRDVKKAMKIDY